jgi:hypothetical protein
MGPTLVVKDLLGYSISIDTSFATHNSLAELKGILLIKAKKNNVQSNNGII